MRDQLLKTALFVGLAASANGENWTGGTSSDWDDVSNWTAAPGGTTIVINNISDGTAFAPQITATPGFTPVDIFIGGGGTGELTQTSGTLSTGAGNWMFVGENGGTGTYNLNGDGSLSAGALNVGAWGGGGATGTVNINTTGSVTLDNGAGRPYGFGDGSLLVGENGSTGTVNLDNGTVTSAFSSWFGVGGGSVGNLNISGGSLATTGNTGFARGGGSANVDISGGSLSTTGEFWVGQDGGGTATLTQSGGSVSSGSFFVIGRMEGANGSYSLSAGTVDAATGGGFTSIASARGATGSLSVSGTGTFNSNAGMILGEGWTGTGSAQGTLTVSGGGAVNVGGFGLELGNDVDAVGTVNLDGGTLTVTDISKGAGTGNFNFNGGLLKASVDSANFIDGVTANVTGGANIDSNGFNVTSTADLVGAGDLDKQGAGSLTLAGSGNSVGAVTVSAGTLFITGQLAATSTTVDAGASIGGNGTLVGNLFLDAGATIDISLGALGIDPGATVSFGGFDFDNLGDFDVNTAAAGTYSVLTGTFTLDSTNIAHYGEGNALDLGGGKTAYFQAGSLEVVVTPEPTVALLGGLGFVVLLGRRRRD